MQRIVITLEGGLISAITADEDIEVLVIDLDTEGTEADEVTMPVTGAPACLLRFQRTGAPDTVERIFENYHVEENL